MANQESLRQLEVGEWSDAMTVFKRDWHRGITGYYALETQKEWMRQGVDYGFKVYCPFGNPANGMVAVLMDKDIHYEMLIECPNDDTATLEDALRKSKVINWERSILVLFASSHVTECLKKIVQDVGVEINRTSALQLYILSEKSPLFDVSLPPGFTFEPLTPEHIELVDSKWPHRYPGSTFYFQLLISTKSGYGLFKNGVLISWIFVKEMGALGHLFTLEDHRKCGFGTLTMKLLCNMRLKEGKDVHSFVIQGNVQSCLLHEKLGFKSHSGIFSLYLKPKARHNFIETNKCNFIQ